MPKISSAKSQYTTIFDTADSFSIQKQLKLMSTDISAKLYDEQININEKAQNTEVITKEDICGEFQSKRPRENVTDDSDEEEPGEKPLSTKADA